MEKGEDKDRNFNAIVGVIRPYPSGSIVDLAPQTPDKPLKPRPGMPIVCACGHLGGRSLPLEWPQARVVPDERVLSSFALPRNALIELVVRHGLRAWIALGRVAARHLPQRRPTGRHQTRRRSRFTQMTENLPDHHRLGDGSDDLHRAATLRARKRRHLVYARQQKRPDVARRLAMHWLCRGRIRRDRLDRRRCGGNPGGLRQRGDRIAQASSAPAPRRCGDDGGAVAGSVPRDDRGVASASASGRHFRPGRASRSRRPDAGRRFHASVPGDNAGAWAPRAPIGALAGALATKSPQALRRAPAVRPISRGPPAPRPA